jgi:hypothetical protein
LIEEQVVAGDRFGDRPQGQLVPEASRMRSRFVAEYDAKRSAHSLCAGLTPQRQCGRSLVR